MTLLGCSKKEDTILEGVNENSTQTDKVNMNKEDFLKKISGFWRSKSDGVEIYWRINPEDKLIVAGLYSEMYLTPLNIEGEEYNQESEIMIMKCEADEIGGNKAKGTYEIKIKDDNNIVLKVLDNKEVVVEHSLSKSSYKDVAYTFYGRGLDMYLSNDNMSAEGKNNSLLDFPANDKLTDKSKVKEDFSKEEALKSVSELENYKDLEAIECDVIPGVRSYKIVNKVLGDNNIIMVVFEGGVTSEDCVEKYLEIMK